ncbi:MAG TPA: hypothetical protein VGB15_09510 [Longimicrobium sp.]|jgi:hypothetical protein
MPGKLIHPSEYRPLRPELQPFFGGFAELRGMMRAQQMRQVIPHTESAEVDAESLHRALDEATAAGRLDGRDG